MWNMRKRHFSHSCKTAAAQPSVKAVRSTPRSGRSAAESLYGRRSGGYARERAGTPVSASILCFQHVDAAATLVTAPVTANRTFPPELAHSTRVDARKHVNASVCAVSGCMALIAFTFPQSYRAVSPQQPAGGDVSPYNRCRRQRRSSAGRSTPVGVGHRCSTEQRDAASGPHLGRFSTVILPSIPMVYM